MNYAAFASLDALDFEPDLLILMATPSQAEVVLRAMSYSTGELWESKKTPVLSCAWIFAYPWLTGKVNYMITGMGFGSKAREALPEGWMLISIPWDKIPVIITEPGEDDVGLAGLHGGSGEVHGEGGAGERGSSPSGTRMRL